MKTQIPKRIDPELVELFIRSIIDNGNAKNNFGHSSALEFVDHIIMGLIHRRGSPDYEEVERMLRG